MTKRSAKWLAVILVATTASVTPSRAEYSDLQAQGYKTGKLTRGASGSLGWYVSNSEKKFFCRMRGIYAYIGKTGLVIFTSSGRPIPLNRKNYMDNPLIPQLSDLRAGKLNSRDVGYCHPAK
ncbi:hypothetical protein MAUB1S_11380 [Mycolicibacterium aubagnense]